MAALCAAALRARAETASAGLALPSFTLGTAMFREPLERSHPAFRRWPDVRLTVDSTRPLDWLPGAVDSPHVSGVEVRFPGSPLWIGYEWADENAPPRATATIRRTF